MNLLHALNLMALLLGPVNLAHAESSDDLEFHASVMAPLPPSDDEGEIERAPWILGQGEQRLLRIPQGLRKFSVGSPCLHGHSLSNAGTDALLLKATCPGQ